MIAERKAAASHQYTALARPLVHRLEHILHIHRPVLGTAYKSTRIENNDTRVALLRSRRYLAQVSAP